MTESKKYAVVCILVSIPEGEKGVPSNWFDGVPQGAMFAGDNLYSGENLVADIGFQLRDAAFAFERKIKLDGWPV